ncbi:Two-component sensor histidine kinase [Halomicronema hongdechloris C2206]|uniref:histidine kinase n=1 Tax=Halomicronema hongdechloris C2206 TaxID=1641165 RepID=A0A1Z3HPN4_9CYAN|nr:GAF domain-containing sensor histidine kinase [Halomicronema hongdechloris]ASC72259.1 Two-component sensor histidine kinase [Halomicronema hongdechloris C2206]
MPTSSEFIALCQSQVLLLTQSFGATSTVVYLAEQWVDHDNPGLVPVVAYPDLPGDWHDLYWDRPLEAGQLPELSTLSLDQKFSLKKPTSALPASSSEPLPEDYPGQVKPVNRVEQEHHAADHQVVLPMVHDDHVVGLLVSVRQRSAWQPEERQQLEGVAQTLALARVLDQRGQWLQQQLQQRQSLQQQQSETFHDLLHQLRNPLTALRTFGKLLLRRLQSDDANQSVITGIVRESDRIRDLLTQLEGTVRDGDATLDRASLSAGEETSFSAGQAKALPPANVSVVRVSPQPCQIASVLTPLVTSAAAMAQEQQIDFHWEIPDGLPPVWGDGRALQEVFSNLMDNAVKYSPKDGVVWVQAGLFRDADSPMQGVLVADRGPGIPAQDQAHIFERRYRGVQNQGQVPGTGLGLAIAHDLIQQLGGCIDVYSPLSHSGIELPTPPNSKNLGPGTAFIVWLPSLAVPFTEAPTLGNP